MKLTTQREAVKKSAERFQESLTAKTGLYGVDTGHHDINLFTGGHVPTKITTFAMRSAGGKSMMLVNMGKSAGRVVNDRRSEILCFSWELSPDYMADRFLCNELGISLS